jgi:hypothetical protein
VQRVQVEARQMTPWKGGGMGMYSEFTYRDHELWIGLEGEGREPEYEYLSETELRELLPTSNRCLRFNSRACLDEVAAGIDALEGGVSRPYRLELWRFARDETHFGRLKELEATYP